MRGERGERAGRHAGRERGRQTAAGRDRDRERDTETLRRPPGCAGWECPAGAGDGAHSPVGRPRTLPAAQLPLQPPACAPEPRRGGPEAPGARAQHRSHRLTPKKVQHSQRQCEEKLQNER